MKSLLPITIVARKLGPSVIAAKQVLLQFLKTHNIPFQIDNHPHTLDGIPDTKTYTTIELSAVTSGLLLSVGGDGSLLRLVRHASHNQLSLLGLNLGRLGFLADLNLSNLTPLLDILNGNYYLEQRDLIAVYAGTKTTDEHYLGSALNDVLVKSDKPGKNIDLKVSIDSKHHFTHHADGFLFSTPTGSTAYALSAGGPVIYPTLPVHLLLPICSHRLNSRPLVLANTSETQLTLGTLVNRTASICIDGRPCGQLKSNMCITIKRAAEKLSLIHSKHYDFLAVAQQKIQWEST